MRIFQVTFIGSCESHPVETEFQQIVEQAVYEKNELESQQQNADPWIKGDHKQW